MIQTLVHSGPVEAINMSTLLPQREQRDLRKLQQVMDPAELVLTHPPVSHDRHMTQLQDGYRQLEEEYLTVIEKLAAAPNTWDIHIIVWLLHCTCWAVYVLIWKN